MNSPDSEYVKNSSLEDLLDGRSQSSKIEKETSRITRIKRDIEAEIEMANQSANDLDSAANIFLSTTERISIVSRRSASTLLGAAIGGVIGILTISSDLPIHKQYENLFIFLSGAAGAASGCLLIRETAEEKARRLEIAAAKLSTFSKMDGFRENLLKQHADLTCAQTRQIFGEYTPLHEDAITGSDKTDSN
jgi:hypothetical protein